MQFRTRKKHVVCRRYSKASPDVVKKIRIMIFKTNPATKRDIANRLGLSLATFNHVTKFSIKCRVKKKTESPSAYSS